MLSRSTTASFPLPQTSICGVDSNSELHMQKDDNKYSKMLPWALFQPTRHVIQPAMIHPVIYGTNRAFSEILRLLAILRSLAIVTNMGIVILSSSPLS